jgi:hypothetical protein
MGTAAYLAEVARLQDALKIAVLAFALAFVFAAIVFSLRSKEGEPHHEGPLAYHSVLLISVMLLGGLFPVDTIFSAPDSAQATPAFPISSRAFLFMGYLILVATAVFMFPAIEIWGSMEMEAFDPLVAAGIVVFGVALVFAEAMRRVGAERAFAAAEPKADI